MTSEEIKQLDDAYIIPTYSRFGPCLIEGKGCRVQDADGNQYLDFTSGIGVNSLGWCDEEWVAAVGEQAGRLQHASNLFCTHPGAMLAQSLCQRTGMSKVFFANSGAEANEGAIKAARKYSRQKYGEGRGVVLSFLNSFHGRTMAALSATGQEGLQQGFSPLLPGFRYLPMNDVEALASSLTAEVCALMIEPIQGEGGVLPFDAAYIKTLETLCREKDILIIADEVQTGMGRTGHFLACEYIGLQADIITLAKGLGGGLPIGAILFSAKADTALGKSDHGTTFGMNPVVCAGANVVVSRLSEAFLQGVTRKGLLLQAGLEALPGVSEVKGAGLMWGLSLPATVTVTQVREKAQELGLLCLTAKNRLRLLPPLVISEAELQEGLALLKKALESFL